MTIQRARAQRVVRFSLVALALAGIAQLSAACGPKPPPPPPAPECDDATPCPDGQVCRSGKCVAAPAAAPRPECASNADCASGKVCKNGRCTACDTAADCDAGQECTNGRCRAPTQISNTQTIPQCELSSVYFDFNQSAIRSDARDALSNAVKCVQERQLTSLRIEGNCDERGDEAYNQSLGERRAQAVKKYLQGQGLKKLKFEVISNGEAGASSCDGDEACWQRDRRGDLK